MRVAILGGTGSFGRALAARLVAAGGHEVVIGSRDAARAEASAAELGSGTSGATNIGSEPAREAALVCGAGDAATALALELAGAVVAGRALDAGPLANARTLEGLTAVIVNINRRYKAHAGVRISGLGP